LQDPISKNPSQKRAGGMAQGVGPEFKPQYHKKKLCETPISTEKAGNGGEVKLSPMDLSPPVDI
jgi:hypothetical protein